MTNIPPPPPPPPPPSTGGPPPPPPPPPPAQKPSTPPVQKSAPHPAQKPSTPPVQKSAPPPAQKPSTPPVQKSAPPPAQKSAPPPAPVPPPPPPPPPGMSGGADPTLSYRLSWPLRVARSVVLGVLSGLALILIAAFVITGGLGPPPGESNVCREVPGSELDERVAGSIERGEVCGEIDSTLDAPLGGPDGFEGVLMAPAPPSDPSTLRPAYLVWETDGCSAPVLGAGPFDFTLACTRHDFGWRNLKQ
ncbi:hypothetical protein HQ535_04700, partial [bacterium]|nr:hypothetical protein [bacterium]